MKTYIDRGFITDNFFTNEYPRKSRTYVVIVSSRNLKNWWFYWQKFGYLCRVVMLASTWRGLVFPHYMANNTSLLSPWTQLLSSSRSGSILLQPGLVWLAQSLRIQIFDNSCPDRVLAIPRDTLNFPLELVFILLWTCGHGSGSTSFSPRIKNTLACSFFFYIIRIHHAHLPKKYGGNDLNC